MLKIESWFLCFTAWFRAVLSYFCLRVSSLQLFPSLFSCYFHDSLAVSLFVPDSSSHDSLWFACLSLNWSPRLVSPTRMLIEFMRQHDCQVWSQKTHSISITSSGGALLFLLVIMIMHFLFYSFIYNFVFSLSHFRLIFCPRDFLFLADTEHCLWNPRMRGETWTRRRTFSFPILALTTPTKG